MFSDALLKFCIIASNTRVRSESGQTLAEYGLVMSVISVAVMFAAVLAFREAIPGAFDSASKCLDTAC